MNIEKLLSTAIKIVSLATQIIILHHWLCKLQLETLLFA